MSRGLLGLVACVWMAGCDDAEPAPTDAATDASTGRQDAGGGDAARSDGAAPDVAIGPDAAPTDALPADSAPDAAAGLPFGSPCAEDRDCQPDLVCRSVGMLGLVCSRECTEDADCPAGSMGPKCNMMGLCRP